MVNLRTLCLVALLSLGATRARAQVGIEGDAAFPAASTRTCSGSLALPFPVIGDVAYDITLTGPCALTFSGGTAGRMQTMELTIHQGSIDGWPITFPALIKWPYGMVPTMNTSAGFYNECTIRTKDGGLTLLGNY